MAAGACFSQKASAHNRGATQHAANAGSDSFDVRPCESLRTCRAAAPVRLGAKPDSDSYGVGSANAADGQDLAGSQLAVRL